MNVDLQIILEDYSMTFESIDMTDEGIIVIAFYMLCSSEI